MASRMHKVSIGIVGACLIFSGLGIYGASVWKTKDRYFNCTRTVVFEQCSLQPAKEYMGITLGANKKAVFEVLCRGRAAQDVFDFSSTYNRAMRSGETASLGGVECSVFHHVAPSDEWRVHSHRATCLFQSDETLNFTFREGRLVELITHCSSIPLI